MSERDELARQVEQLRGVVEELGKKNRQLEEKVVQLYTLYNLAKALSVSYDFDEQLKIAYRMINSSVSIAEFGLYLKQESEDMEAEADGAEPDILSLRINHGVFSRSQPESITVADDHLIGEAFRSGRAIFLADGREAEFANRTWLPTMQAASVLAVPLRQEGLPPVGVLVMHSLGTDGFTRDEIRLFESIGEHLAISFQHASVYNRAQRRSHIDPVTKVYNRQYFDDRIEREIYRARRYSRRFLLFLAVVENFEKVGQRYGRALADETIGKVAGLFTRALRKSDLVARFDTAEFVMLLPETDLPTAQRVAQRLRVAMANLDLGEVDPRKVKLELRFGMASFPEDGADRGALMAFAERQL